MTAQPQGWLVENGPKELEQLFRAIMFCSSAPSVLADDLRQSKEVSIGASKLLGLRREKIIGRRLDEFAPADFRPVLSERWDNFLKEGEQQGTLSLIGPEGTSQVVEYSAKSSVLPVRHLVVLRNKTPSTKVLTWAQDCALLLVDSEGIVVAWYAGAQRIYGYTSEETVGRHLSAVDPAGEELKRAAQEGHAGTEGWKIRKDGSRFWANSITMALKDEEGSPQGFARVVRDFTDRHERDEKLRRERALRRGVPAESAIAGIISGEFDHTPEANDAFLEMVGYSREDLQSGRLHWTDLTPLEFSALDEFAHEEGLRFGACTPFEKELICKDGSRVRVLVATAVLKLSPFRWITFVQDLSETERPDEFEEEPAEGQHGFEDIVGTSAAVRRVERQVQLVAPTDATVLILGETGTGKELVARAVHKISPRRNLPFVTLNCAAIPTGLLESELFGYERGAFTGALTQKIGRFEMAHRGTLFLDEVGDIPLDLQPKLLRALQEKSFERLGGTRTIPIDVRLIAATNRNLTQMMGDKLFRSDLYYRLKVFPIIMSPLRDHPEDIPLLANYFTKKHAATMERKIEKISPETMRALVRWRWPGNIRELENFIERCVILSSGPNLRAPLAELRESDNGAPGGSTLEEVDRNHILRVFRESGGVVSTAAIRLGMPRTTLNAMMKKLGISRSNL